MAPYILVDAEWLDREIDNARTLADHAENTGKPVAIAACRVRLESLKEVRKLSRALPGPGKSLKIAEDGEPIFEA